MSNNYTLKGLFIVGWVGARNPTKPFSLELGFMINPNEFEWIINHLEQQKLAQVIADGITTWLINK